jgi:hypothetical protein
MTTGTSSSTASGFKGIDVAGTGNFSISNNIIGNDQANNIRSGYFLSASNLSNAATTPTTATGTSAVQGIVSTSTGNVLTITNNTIKGLQISGSVSTHNAIITSGTMTGSTPAVNVNSNSLGNSTLGWINYAVANSGSLTGISVANTIATVHNINSNNFSGITYSVAGTNSNTYINFTGGTAANNISSISSNTFTNLSINTSGSVLFIGHGYSISSNGQLIINNNSIVTAFTRLAAGSITISTSNSASTSNVDFPLLYLLTVKSSIYLSILKEVLSLDTLKFWRSLEESHSVFVICFSYDFDILIVSSSFCIP